MVPFSAPNEKSISAEWFVWLQIDFCILRRFFLQSQTVENQYYAEYTSFVWNIYVPYPLRSVCPAVYLFPLRAKTKAGRKVLLPPLPAISFLTEFFDGCSVDYCLPPAFQKFSSFSIFAFWALYSALAFSYSAFLRCTSWIFSFRRLADPEMLTSSWAAFVQ